MGGKKMLFVGLKLKSYVCILYAVVHKKIIQGEETCMSNEQAHVILYCQIMIYVVNLLFEMCVFFFFLHAVLRL